MCCRLDIDDFHHYHAFDVHVLGKKLDKHGINGHFFKYGKKWKCKIKKNSFSTNKMVFWFSD
jgi:hypothetical protein